MAANSLKIARAYSVFANKGYIVEPKIKFDEEVVEKKVLDEAIAIYILDALRDVVLNGTAKDLENTSVSLAGKTGTAEKYVEGVRRAKDG